MHIRKFCLFCAKRHKHERTVWLQFIYQHHTDNLNNGSKPAYSSLRNETKPNQPNETNQNETRFADRLTTGKVLRLAKPRRAPKLQGSNWRTIFVYILFSKCYEVNNALTTKWWWDETLKCTLEFFFFFYVRPMEIEIERLKTNWRDWRQIITLTCLWFKHFPLVDELWVE